MALGISSIFKRLHRTIGNLRTGIVLLLLVVVASALGTFILQRPVTDPEKLAQVYSPTTLRWLDRLSLTDIFHASWFLVLMGLVSLSIIVISVDRFPNAWRFYARPYRKTDSHFRGSLPKKIELPINNTEDGLNAAERALKKFGWPVERIADNNEPSLYSERHRFSVMAVYIVHASLLLIFAGGIVDGVFGYSGFMALQNGQTSNQIELRKGGTRQNSILRKVQRRRAGKLCGRFAQTLVVEAGGDAERPRGCSEGNRGERSPGPSGITLLPGELWQHGQTYRLESRCNSRHYGRFDEIRFSGQSGGRASRNYAVLQPARATGRKHDGHSRRIYSRLLHSRQPDLQALG